MKRKATITLGEIAEMLELSKATVSNALTGNRYVSPSTVKKVREISEKYGYRANHLARGLRTRKTNVIGITVPDITEPFYSSMVRYVEEELKARGYTILLGSYNFDYEEEKRIAETFQGFMVDGMIVIAGLNETDEFYGELSADLPIVFLDRYVEDKRIYSVVADHRQIGIDAVDYLVGKGHRKIIHLTIPFGDFRTAELRAQGYAEGLAMHGLEKQNSTILVEPSMRLNEIPTSIAIAKRISRLKATAVFAVSDYVAIGLLKGLSSLGVKIPEEVSILSVTNTNYCLVTSPTLTSISLSPVESTQKAVEILLNLLSPKRRRPESVTVAHSIVERESVRDLS